MDIDNLGISWFTTTKHLKNKMDFNKQFLAECSKIYNVEDNQSITHHLYDAILHHTSHKTYSKKLSYVLYNDKGSYGFRFSFKNNILKINKTSA